MIAEAITGAAVPLSALYTDKSAGIGEYSDLTAFGSWCKKAGIDLIQILPVNDTGTNPSPYSAISGYALHPIFLRLDEIPGSRQFAQEIETLRDRYRSEDRVKFQDILSGKLALLRQIFDQDPEAIINGEDIRKWARENPWIETYAVFRSLKTYYDEQSWNSWPTMRDPRREDIEAYHKDNPKEIGYYIWLQYHCERQLRRAARALEEMGIALKGDLPILMQEDSADVWFHRENFIMRLRAGAPPDMYSSTGQNWGFPIYNWETIEADEFNWWKGRLKQAAKFYHAYRIDHVLGFFRIWAIPEYESAGSMGYFLPSVFITAEDLKQAGFSEERITWLSEPHIPTEEIKEALGDSADQVFPHLRRVGSEELFRIDPQIRGSRAIEALDISDEAKAALNRWNRNRALIKIETDTYAPAWLFSDSGSYQSLSEEEKNRFKDLVHTKGEESELLWEKTGRHLLSFMEEETEMLICAEDLGVVPQCVPKVLEELGILGLKICFWTRDYDNPEAPFISPRKYPHVSVAMLSAHDTVTMRQWWEEQADESTKTAFAKAFFENTESKIADRTAYSPDLALLVNSAFLQAGSRLCVFQIQELFSLTDTYRSTDPGSERINVPGTVTPENWSYRIPVPLEELAEDEYFILTVSAMIEENRHNP